MESKTDSEINFHELLLGTATRVRHITRWSNFPKVHPESVAEHSFFTSMCALIIATDMRSCGLIVDVGLVLSRAIMHDVEEAFSGDFVRSFKHSDPELDNAITCAAGRFHLQFCNALIGRESANELHDYWLHAKNADLEGSIVAFADYLALISYVMCEMRSGNSHMLERRMSLIEYGMQFTTNLYLHRYADIVLTIFGEEVMRCLPKNPDDPGLT